MEDDCNFLHSHIESASIVLKQRRELFERNSKTISDLDEALKKSEIERDQATSEKLKLDNESKKQLQLIGRCLYNIIPVMFNI